LNFKVVNEIIDDFTNVFDQIIISIDAAYGLIPQIQSEFQNYYYYTIKPLGYKKNNDLIKRYHSLKENPLLINEKDLFQKTKQTFDQVRQIIGNKIIPSYPVFILSILQALDYKPLNLNETSYGYCYQTLIHFALVNKAFLPNDEIDSYINYLKELAFHFYESGIDEIDEDAFVKFHSKYGDSFLIPDFKKVKQTLVQSQILSSNDSCYKFGYRYILYFLVAKYISEIINTPKGENAVKNLFDKVHLEEYANILVFITHHTKEIAFIEESLFSTMTPFEDSRVITLEKGDEYYKLIQDITKEISADIIEINRKPEDEREKYLIEQDKKSRIIEKNKSHVEDIEDSAKESLFPFYKSYRSIEIVGQIIKNRKGSLPKDKLLELITELYYLCFRTIGYLGEMFEGAKSEILLMLYDRIKDGDNKKEIEQKINKFFQYISLQTCLNVFTKLIFSIGIKDLKEIYKEVAKNINSPAAKIVSFSINSYYNDVSASEIKSIAKELEDNHVAFQILRYRVKAYLYNNHVEYKKKQKIADALNMKISPLPVKR
jgi:hypothetical protein